MKILRYVVILAFTASVCTLIAALIYRSRVVSTPDTVQELADRLRANGIPYDRVEAIREFPWESSKITESIALRGTDLFVEILRIDDPATFEAAEEAGSKYAALRGGIEWEPVHTIEIVARRPYVVVIREEPKRGQIAAILQRLLPNQVT